MNINVDQQGNSKVAVIESPDIIIHDVQDAMDLMASIQYNQDCSKIMINQSNVTEQ
ncbi:DUF4180 domain-containing protein [Paenibacillus sp. GCM10028914]|uniref:DUF4180 domain-containing protein n=1 Tax=Paenibacillus sp. GCM10028914 TaxID=3273416 RepID=UPI0036170935